jgi:hypothetical protein
LTADDLTDELTFLGMRPRSQQRMQLVAPYLAARRERDSLRATLEATYAAGLLSDSDLKNQLEGIEHNNNREDLAVTAARWRKTIKITADLEQEYSTLYIGGLITDAELHQNLTGIGLQDDYANAVAAKAEARANANLQKQTMQEARALARVTAAEARRAAMKRFTSGGSTAVELTAELIATGLTAIQTAAWLELAQLQKAGGLRWLYGRQLSPGDATLLRQRVAALTDQFKRLQIDQQQYHDQLAQLGLGPQWVEALEATAAAAITPKTKAFALPVKAS